MANNSRILTFYKTFKNIPHTLQPAHLQWQTVYFWDFIRWPPHLPKINGLEYILTVKYEKKFSG